MPFLRKISLSESAYFGALTNIVAYEIYNFLVRLPAVRKAFWRKISAVELVCLRENTIFGKN